MSFNLLFFCSFIVFLIMKGKLVFAGRDDYESTPRHVIKVL